jgi:transcriptional regulator with XRE-family HTH domain
MQTTGQKITGFRIRRGWTQEDLADRVGVTVRTIQRIENGDTRPRLYTLKALAGVLEIGLEVLLEPASIKAETVTPGAAVEPAMAPMAASPDLEMEKQDDLYLLNLSSFLYLVIPFVHALFPYRIWRKHRSDLYVPGKRIVLFQLKWTIALHGLLLITLVYNLILVWCLGPAANAWLVNYLWIVAFMYALNAVVILRTAFLIRTGRIAVGNGLYGPASR